MPFELIALAPLLPLLATALVAAWHIFGAPGGDAAEARTVRLLSYAMLGSLAVLLAMDARALLYGAPGEIVLGTWFAAGGIQIPASFMIDALSLPFATLIAVIGYIALKFSANYLHRERGFHRFFIINGLFLTGMLMLVLSGNIVLSFVGWEIVGVSSYLLIGYAFERTVATGSAVRAFVTNRIGDAGFILAIALTLHYFDSFAWSGLGAAAISTGTVSVSLVALGFVVAALAKSAQVPFTPWITRALEGPTPSSAIFYGSLMVHAGVYLILRLEPVLVQAPLLLVLIAVAGLETALYGWFGGLVQSDVKSALLFGTLTQIGIMFVTIGFGAFDVAAWHMCLHATFRAWQFLSAPSYMHAVKGASVEVPPWLGRSQRWYTAILERFWLERFGDALLTLPMQDLGRDMRLFDERIVSRMLGAPGDSEFSPHRQNRLVRGRGVAGALLEWCAANLYRLEQHLLMGTEGGPTRRTLRALSEYLAVLESMLEQPRYLILLILIIFIAGM